MFGLFQRQKLYEQEAASVYEAARSHIRAPVFYDALGVEDSFEGRFDLLLVHIFLIYRAAGPQSDFSQRLFDILFADMERALRELGAGDMGIHKHMKRMMLAHNGRMNAYEQAMESGRAEALREALARNLYGENTKAAPESIDAMASYMHECAQDLSAQGREAILQGHIRFPAPRS